MVDGEVEKEDCSKVQHWRKNGDPRNDVYGGQSIVVKSADRRLLAGWYLVKCHKVNEQQEG